MKFHLQSLALLGVLFTGLAGHSDPFNEVYHPNGQVRYKYQKIFSIYKKLSPEKKKTVLKKTTQALEGDNAVFPLPRVLSESEFKNLQMGVQQRATALKLFLKDYYSGRRSFETAGVIPKGVVDVIVKRHGEEGWLGKIDSEKINWLYGPDIFRISDGRFAVAEDNFGYVGGFGDLITARESILKEIPAYEKNLTSPDPSKFYKDLVERYKSRAVPPGSRVVLLQYTLDGTVDNEDKRVTKIFEEQGIDIVKVRFRRKSELKNKLVVKKDGVYFVKKIGSAPEQEFKVGFVGAFTATADIDSKNVSAQKTLMIETAKDVLEDAESYSVEALAKIRGILHNPKKINFKALEKALFEAGVPKDWLGKDLGVPGLFDAFLKGHVGMNATPGISFVEDKEFYTYTGDLIRHYLHQEPLLVTLPTKSFRDLSILDDVLDHPEKWVIKGVAGMGGNEVWVGPKMKKEDFKALREMILQSPGKYIAQEYHELSELDGMITDLRLHADVGPEIGDVMTAPVPWGRCVSKAGDGKVNISANGSETVVFIVKDPPICDRPLLPL